MHTVDFHHSRKRLPSSPLWVALAVLSLPFLTEPAYAMVGFNSGPIISSERCEIVVTAPGTMTTNATGDVLSSREAGGAGGVATVTSYKFNGAAGPGPRFSVTFEAPTTFDTMPVGGDSGVSFEPRFSGVNISRGRNFNNRLGTNRIRLRRRGVSVTEITADLIATRTGSTFPAGNYAATGTLRCE